MFRYLQSRGIAGSMARVNRHSRSPLFGRSNVAYVRNIHVVIDFDQFAQLYMIVPERVVCAPACRLAQKQSWSWDLRCRQPVTDRSDRLEPVAVAVAATAMPEDVCGPASAWPAGGPHPGRCAGAQNETAAAITLSAAASHDCQSLAAISGRPKS